MAKKCLLSLPTIEEPNFNKLMEGQAEISFIEHDSFGREIEKFNKKHDGGIGYKSLKKLLQINFNPIKSQVVLTPKVLKKVNNLGANIEVYKVIMRVKGLSSGQSPRVCFRVEGNLITFLCYGSHSEDYKDNELRELIKKRIKDLDPDVQLRARPLIT